MTDFSVHTKAAKTSSEIILGTGTYTTDLLQCHNSSVFGLKAMDGNSLTASI